MAYAVSAGTDMLIRVGIRFARLSVSSLDVDR